MIGFKDAEGLCSNMLLSTKECLGERLQVLECLSSQGLTLSVSSAIEGTVGSIGSMGSYSGTTSTSVIKARFRSFNKQFEEVCQTQINWAIPDREL
jgi:exocyst complex protein 7